MLNWTIFWFSFVWGLTLMWNVCPKKLIVSLVLFSIEMLDLSLPSFISLTVTPSALWSQERKKLYISLCLSLSVSPGRTGNNGWRRNISILCEGCWLYEKENNILWAEFIAGVLFLLWDDHVGWDLAPYKISFISYHHTKAGSISLFIYKNIFFLLPTKIRHRNWVWVFPSETAGLRRRSLLVLVWNFSYK